MVRTKLCVVELRAFPLETLTWLCTDDDDVPGFAPSLKTMLSSFNSDATAAKKAFCGLKATVYSPKTGRQVPMIIADAFDDKWVRTPNSIDVIYGSVRWRSQTSFALVPASAWLIPSRSFPSSSAARQTTKTTLSRMSGGCSLASGTRSAFHFLPLRSFALFEPAVHARSLFRRFTYKGTGVG